MIRKRNFYNKDAMESKVNYVQTDIKDTTGVSAVECIYTPPVRLWVLEYDVEGFGRGCAVCKADNAQMAESMLKVSGRYNAAPSLYKVTRIEEIIAPPCNELIAEQVITFKEVSNE